MLSINSGHVSQESRLQPINGRNPAKAGTPGCDRTYAVVEPTEDPVSGRAEPDILVQEMLVLSAKISRTRSGMYHTAAGASGFHRIKRPV